MIFCSSNPRPPLNEARLLVLSSGRISLGEGGVCVWQLIYDPLCLCWSVAEHLAVSDDVFAGVCGLWLSLWLLSNYIISYSSSCIAINPQRWFVDTPSRTSLAFGSHWELFIRGNIWQHLVLTLDINHTDKCLSVFCGDILSLKC